MAAETFTRQGVTYTVVDPWVEFIESGSRTRKNPDGFSRWVRLDRIDAVSNTYEGGGCTISVNGTHFHVETDAEEVLAMIREIDNPSVPSTGPR